MNWCSFCGKPCGEREFCDEVCYNEYHQAMEEFRARLWEEMTPEQKAALYDLEEPRANDDWCGSKGCNF